MTGILSLWLPILLSAVAVFVVSSLIHMFSPWHKNDFARLPNEDALRSAVGPLAVPPGDYMVPMATRRDEMRSEPFKEKMRMGPNIIMTVLPNEVVGIGRSLALWFGYLLGVGILSAYIASRALPQGGTNLEIVRFAGATAFIAYAAALWQASIWYRKSWATTIKANVDGIIYALITGWIFALLWPH